MVPDLVLLHGALGAADQFEGLRPLLDEHFRVWCPDLEGHGRAPLRSRPFRIEHFVEDVLEHLDAHSIPAAHFFGYSLGGYVACTLARTHPERALNVATLGTIFYWDSQTARREAALLDPAKITAKVPRFAQALAARHSGAGWETVCHETAGLLWSLAEVGGLRPAQAAQIPQRVRILIGDRDTTASLADSAEVYRGLPRGELEVLPDTPHPLEKVSAPRLARSLSEFFQQG